MHSLKAIVISLLALTQGSAAIITTTKTTTTTTRLTRTLHLTTTATVTVPSSTKYLKTITVTVPVDPSFTVASDSAQQTLGGGKLARRIDAIDNVENAAPLDARAAKTKTVVTTKTVTKRTTVTSLSYSTTTVTSGVLHTRTTTSVYAACATDSGNILGGSLNNPPGGYFIYDVESTDPNDNFENDYSASDASDCCNICFNTPGCLGGFYIAFYNTCGLDMDTSIQCNQATTPTSNITVSNDQSQNVNIQVFNGPCGVNVLG